MARPRNPTPPCSSSPSSRCPDGSRPASCRRARPSRRPRWPRPRWPTRCTPYSRHRRGGGYWYSTVRRGRGCRPGSTSCRSAVAASTSDWPAAFAAVRGPALLIGMDTPQLTPGLLLVDWEVADAWFGPAADGGFWGLGLRVPDPALVRGVPMSTANTGASQRARLHAAGLRVADLPLLRDVDTAADAVAVARQAPWSRFAAQVRELAPVLDPAAAGHRPAGPCESRYEAGGDWPVRGGAGYVGCHAVAADGVRPRAAAPGGPLVRAARPGRRGVAPPMPGAGTRHRLRPRAPDHRAGGARDPRARRGHLPYCRGPGAPGRGVRHPPFGIRTAARPGPMGDARCSPTATSASAVTPTNCCAVARGCWLPAAGC